MSMGEQVIPLPQKCHQLLHYRHILRVDWDVHQDLRTLEDYAQESKQISDNTSIGLTPLSQTLLS